MCLCRQAEPSCAQSSRPRCPQGTGAGALLGVVLAMGVGDAVTGIFVLLSPGAVQALGELG